MQKNLQLDGKTRGSIIFLKRGKVYTSSHKVLKIDSTFKHIVSKTNSLLTEKTTRRSDIN